MAKKERFGKFVLLRELGSSGLGAEHRAAKLAAGGALERLTLLVRLAPSLSGNAGFAKALMDHAKAVSLLHSPNVLKLVAIGRVEATYYLAYEHVEGRSLKAILERSRAEGFPLAPDHALLIASKVLAALEYAHGKKGEHGRYVHGLLTPDAAVVTYDGDVKVRSFGVFASGIREAGGITAEEQRYLAPEQQSGAAEVRSDVYGAGALLFETLTGRTFGADGGDLAAQLSNARLAGGADAEPLPKPMLELLARSLAREPSGRYADASEMRRAVDGLLFSGEFNPTTFNLAFFMHSLLREELERDTQAVAEEKAANYSEYWIDDAAKTAAASRPAPPAAAPPAPAAPAPVAPAREEPKPVAREEVRVPEPIVAGPELQIAPAPAHTAAHPAPAHAAPAHAAPAHATQAHAAPTPPAPAAAAPAHAAPASARQAAAGLTFHKVEPKRGLPVLPIAAGLAVVVGGLTWYLMAGPGSRPAPTPPPSTLSAEAAAALQRVKELEEKLKRFEEEKAEAEAKAAEDAKKKVEAQAAARGQAVDPAALQKAQEDARRRAQQEQERKQREERQRVEEEQRQAEARLAEERRRAEAAAAAAAAATLPPATLPVTMASAPSIPEPPPATPAAPAAASAAPTVKLGALVNIAEPGVIPPVLDRQAQLVYPPLALQQRAEGTVELNVLIDERGTVTDAKVVKGTSGMGLNQAAIDNVKRRKYRPATKDGVAVKVYLTVIVKFALPK